MKKQGVLLAALVCLLGLAVSARADDDCYKVAKGQEFLYKASGRAWSPSGTEGMLQYTLTDDDGYGGGLVYTHVWNLPFDGLRMNDTRTSANGLKINYESRKCTDAGGPGKCTGCQWILSLTR